MKLPRLRTTKDAVSGEKVSPLAHPPRHRLLPGNLPVPHPPETFSPSPSPTSAQTAIASATSPSAATPTITLTAATTATAGATTSPTPTFTPPSGEICLCIPGIYTCDDFFDLEEAQGCFDYCNAMGFGDIHNLDGNLDGLACNAAPYP